MEQFQKIMRELADKGEQCLQDIDNWYKDFEGWRDCLLDDIEQLKDPKAKVAPLIPVTPAASFRKNTRRRLSTVPEMCDKANAQEASTSIEERASTSADERPRRRAAKNASRQIASLHKRGGETENGPLRRSKRTRSARRNSAQSENESTTETLESSSRNICNKKVDLHPGLSSLPIEDQISLPGDGRSVNIKEKSMDKLDRGSSNKKRVEASLRKKSKILSADKQADKSPVKKQTGETPADEQSGTTFAETKPEETSADTGSKKTLANRKSEEIYINRMSTDKQTKTTSRELSKKISANRQSAKRADEPQETFVQNISVTEKGSVSKEIAGNSVDELPRGTFAEEMALNKSMVRETSVRVLCERLSRTTARPVIRTSKVKQYSKKLSGASTQRMTRHTFKKFSQRANSKPSASSMLNTGNSEELERECLENEEKDAQEAVENEVEMEPNDSEDESNYCSADEEITINKTDGLVSNENVQIVSSDETDADEIKPPNKTADVPRSHTVTKPPSAKSPALFSPYANEPVKNRVAAYETINCIPEETEKEVIPVRMTRTKTRALAAKATAAPRIDEGQKLVKAVKKLASSNVAAKENYFPSASKYMMGSKLTPSVPSKVLTQNNSLVGSARKTPMTNSTLLSMNASSAGQLNKVNKPGVILNNIHTFIKKKVKPVADVESLKLEEQRKRQEKEKEAQRRKEELLKKKAEEQKKKLDEKRMKVQQNREAQEKEKQESQLRLGREKTEKMNTMLQLRDAKQKEEMLQKKIEAERKAAEARRKHEEAEAARIAKLKLEEQRRKEQEEQQRRKEQEENEVQRQGVKRAAEEKEGSAKREKLEAPTTSAASGHVDLHKVPPKEALNSTFTKTNNVRNNVFNLNEIDTEESSDEESSKKKPTALWATKQRLLHKSELELEFHELAEEFFACPKGPMDLRKIFNSHCKRDYKRTSSAIWHTPPRYSQLPKY